MHEGVLVWVREREVLHQPFFATVPRHIGNSLVGPLWDAPPTGSMVCFVNCPKADSVP